MKTTERVHSTKQRNMAGAPACLVVDIAKMFSTKHRWCFCVFDLL